MKKQSIISSVIIILSSLLLFAYDAISDNRAIEPAAIRGTVECAARPLTQADSILPLDTSVRLRLTSTVYGYLPDWKYPAAVEDLRYDMLTHISVFSFRLNRDMSLSAPAGWPWIGMINQAHQNGVKVIMTVFTQDTETISLLLNDHALRESFAAEVSRLVGLYKLDGVNIDFEDISRAERGRLLNTFLESVRLKVHADNPGSEVSFAGPAVNWGGWDFVGLSDAVDYIFVMSYDYYDKNSPVSGPASSLKGEYYSVANTFTDKTQGYGAITQSNPEKLILGVPFYGYHWKTETEDVHSPNVKFVENTQYKYNAVDVLRYKRIWDKSYNVPWYKYQQDGQWHQVWYEDNRSIGLKYDFAMIKGLKGVGMWALGFDGGRAELWNEIKRRFYVEDGMWLAEKKYSPKKALQQPFIATKLRQQLGKG